MASTIPATANNTSTSSHSHSRSRSNIPSRPTTPLRPPSRTSLRASQSTPTAGSSIGTNNDFPLAILEPAFGEFSDAMADLEANMMHLQLLNDSLNRFNENFGAFLYGMNMSAFCVDFPEAPIPQSFTLHKDTTNPNPTYPYIPRTTAPQPDSEATFLTNDTSFIENPPTSSKPSSKFSSVPPSSARTTPGRGRGRAAGGSSGIARGASGIARGARAGRGSGIARGVGRGRGVR